MKNAPANKPSSPSSWRLINQNVMPRTSTPISRKRQNYAMLKTITIVAVLSLCAWAGFEIYTAWSENPANIKAPVKGEPLKHITVRNDNGVLGRDWVEQTLALPKGISLIELDITALRNRLLANQQIRTAVLTRQFPDTLAVTLEERAPVARLIVQQTPGAPLEELLVARDGAIFPGANFLPATLAALPYLADATLIRAAPGSTQFAPLDGIDDVAKLVDAARINIPNLYPAWKSISLKRYADDSVLIANIADGSQIIFDIRKDDFATQIGRLDLIIDNLRNAPPDFTRGPLRTIDLSVGQTVNGVQVPVTFEPPVPQPPTRPANRR